METLGSLIDKLTVIKLKEFHNKDWMRKKNLEVQEQELLYEITDYLHNAVTGKINWEKLTIQSNKIHEGTAMPEIESQSIGINVSMLAKANCEIWHLQEKLYNFNMIPAEEKDAVVAAITTENLKRVRCIEGIDKLLQEMVIE